MLWRREISLRPTKCCCQGHRGSRVGQRVSLRCGTRGWRTAHRTTASTVDCPWPRPWYPPSWLGPSGSTVSQARTSSYRAAFSRSPTGGRSRSCDLWPRRFRSSGGSPRLPRNNFHLLRLDLHSQLRRRSAHQLSLLSSRGSDSRKCLRSRSRVYQSQKLSAS